MNSTIAATCNAPDANAERRISVAWKWSIVVSIKIENGRVRQPLPNNLARHALA